MKEYDPKRELRKDRRSAFVGIFLGGFLLVACPVLALYDGYWQHKFLKDGRYSQ
jgi:hypothetical protein